MRSARKRKTGIPKCGKRSERRPSIAGGLKQRYKIERQFGEAKLRHRLGRCRYLGRVRYGLQAYLTMIGLNLKRIVWLLIGVHFRTPAQKECWAASGLP